MGNGVVGPDGSFSVSGNTSGMNPGDTVEAHAGSGSGPSVGSVVLLTGGGGPAAPQGNLDGGATVLTINGTPGELVTVINVTTGEVLGSATIQPDGQAAINFDTAVLTGQNLILTTNGENSGAITAVFPGSAPFVAQGSVLVDGSVLTGSGVAGSLVQVVDDQGRVLGSSIVAPDGTWAITTSGALAGVGVKVIQDGVETRLPQPALRLGEEKVFLSKNVFRPLRGDSLDIGFKAPFDDKVTVKIFNLSGETVRLVAEIEVRAGVLYALRWSGQNDAGEMVASGIHFVSVYGPKTRIIKKVVVLK